MENQVNVNKENPEQLSFQNHQNKKENKIQVQKYDDPDIDNESAEELNVNDRNRYVKNNLSDSELMELSDLKAKKNKSNLYLIKSYSFIDKTTRNKKHKNQSINEKSKLQTIEKTMTNKCKNKNKNKNKARKKKNKPSPDSGELANSKSSEHANVRTEQETDDHGKDGGDGTVTAVKINGGNSYDANSCECNVLLRQQRSIEEYESKFNEKPNYFLNKQRPKSMPTTTIKNKRKLSLNEKLLRFQDTIESTTRNAVIKRSSFLRQSFQSIRRSFSGRKNRLKKDNQNNNKNEKSIEESTSNTSTCSASSCSSNYVKDIDALFADENESSSCRTSRNRGVVILLNGVDVGVNENGVRSTNSVVTLPNGTDVATSNDANLTTLAPSTLLPGHVEAQSIDYLNRYDDDQNLPYQDDCDPNNLRETFDVELRKPHTQRQQHKQHRKQSSTGSATSQNNGYYSSLPNDQSPNLIGSHKKRGARTLKQNKSESAIPTNSTLGLDSLTPIPSTHSLRSISPTGSRESTSGSISSNNSDNTAKRDEQSSVAAVGSTTAVAATGTGALVQTVEKEKKRKEVSSSRVKKFHRHFSQVPKDEKLINYFSCALVSDILLQGHLYITDQHFAFYSNVFGYVTKVVIPTSSVTKISKEKTAKIIPNAVGVATADERHVFGSFISREQAFRLMCSVCPPLGTIEMLPKVPADIEISEEYSIEDDSSCSISGNESPPGNGVIAACNSDVGNNNQALLRRTVLSSSLNNNVSDKKSSLSASNDKLRHSDIPLNAKVISSKTSNSHQHGNNTSSHHKLPVSCVASPTYAGAAATAASNLTMIIAAGATATAPASATTTPSTTSSSPTTVMATPTGPTESSNSSVSFHFKSINRKESISMAIVDSFKAFTSKASLRLKFPTELSIVYLGVILSLILAVFSVFLLYRIVDIEARASLYRSPMNFNWHSGHDDDIFAEALRWQRQLQDKSTAEAQNILSTNLEQIAKVRRSLETLSMLIRDRSSASSATVDDNSD